MFPQSPGLLLVSWINVVCWRVLKVYFVILRKYFTNCWNLLKWLTAQIVKYRWLVTTKILWTCSLNSKNPRRWSFSQPHLLRTGVQAPLIIADWTLDILWLSWDVLHHITDKFRLFLHSSSTQIRLVRVSTNGLRGGIGVGMTKLNGDLLYFDGRTEWIPWVMYVMIR